MPWTMRGLFEVGQAAVRARSDEGDVDFVPRDAPPAVNPMNASASSSASAGDRLADADRLARIDAPGDGRLDRGASNVTRSS